MQKPQSKSYGFYIVDFKCDQCKALQKDVKHTMVGVESILQAESDEREVKGSLLWW